MRTEFINAIKNHQAAFGLEITDEKISLLSNYYEIIQKHNEILHLVAPMSAEEFAIRHILESLTLLEHLPENTSFADVGSGAGLPSVPCLIVRDDLKAILIESKLKKAGFLQTVLADCELRKRAEIINRQFAEIEKPDVSYVSCRAIDKFTQNLPRLIKWSGNCTLLFFGGRSLRDELVKNLIKFDEKLMPMSEQRYLFISSRRTK